MVEDRLTEHVAELGLDTPRARVRHVALDVLSTGAQLAGRAQRALERPRIQHLFFHHVFDDEEDAFRALIEDLSRDHTFLAYGDSVERIWSGQIDRPYLAISFDDGLASCLRAGRILTEHGISACFFVVVGMVGERDRERVARFCRERLAMPPTAFLDWDEIEELRALGHEIGSHTMTHARLSELDESSLAAELDEPHRVLTEHTGSAPHFAWPYGHFSDAFPGVTARARQAGFASCAANERGAHTVRADPDRLCIRRDHVLARWPVRHIRWFLARNAMRSTAATNEFGA
jgi:peptidoglycan/xylan/chitin deacetylase (PgdA/CDA1 family)